MTRIGKDDPRDDLTVVSVAKRQWEKTFDAISDPLMIVDDDYVIRRANLALADDLGIAIQRLVGQRCHEVRGGSARAFVRSEGRPCHGCPIPEARRTLAPRDGELEAARGRVYRLRAYPLEDVGPNTATEPLMVCAYRDVTEEREMTRQLSNAEKLAAIGRLAGGVAHEINNPLGGILAFAQILLREECSPDEVREYLREIEKSAFRCKGIVEALLRFSRQQPSALERGRLELNQVVREALAAVSEKYRQREVEIHCDLAEELPAVAGNAEQIEQVLVNLLSNAFDAVAGRPPRAAIEVRTTPADGGGVTLEVADTGAGIEEAHLEKVFDPFFTTKEGGEGSGLGLAVSYAIVRDHGGQIVVRNRAEGGAVFTVTLPSAPSPG